MRKIQNQTQEFNDILKDKEQDSEDDTMILSLVGNNKLKSLPTKVSKTLY